MPHSSVIVFQQRCSLPYCVTIFASFPNENRPFHSIPKTIRSQTTSSSLGGKNPQTLEGQRTISAQAGAAGNLDVAVMCVNVCVQSVELVCLS